MNLGMLLSHPRWYAAATAVGAVDDVATVVSF
jgi:hypothetical protein